MQKLLSKRSISETIAEKVDTPCWLCGGTPNVDGYIRLRLADYRTYAHRAAAWLWLGLALDSDLLALHKCVDRKACFNPAHLYIGTQANNNRDTVADGRRQLNSELSKAEIRQLIFGVRAGKYSVSRWAQAHNVFYSTARRAYNCVTYRAIGAKAHKEANKRFGAATGYGPMLFSNVPLIGQPTVINPEYDADYLAVAEEVALVADEVPF